jgi:hypothetical protein
MRTLAPLLPFVMLVSVALALPACSQAQADTTPPPASAAPPPAAVLVPNKTAPSGAFSTKVYGKVLQTGDSMVGGGFCRALAPRFAAEGSKYVRDVWESGSIEAFADSDRLPRLIAHHDPDLVLLNLGANDVGGNVTDYLGKKIEKVAAMTQHGGPRDCVWIGPPRWKLNGKPVVDMIRAHASPCTFFDSTDIEMHRKADKVHPDERGGDEWAVAFWHFFRGPEADAGTFDWARNVLH